MGASLRRGSELFEGFGLTQGGHTWTDEIRASCGLGLYSVQEFKLFLILLRDVLKAAGLDPEFEAEAFGRIGLTESNRFELCVCVCDEEEDVLAGDGGPVGPLWIHFDRSLESISAEITVHVLW